MEFIRSFSMKRNSRKEKNLLFIAIFTHSGLTLMYAGKGELKIIYMIDIDSLPEKNYRP
jgi:hypothetical protein